MVVRKPFCVSREGRVSDDDAQMKWMRRENARHITNGLRPRLHLHRSVVLYLRHADDGPCPIRAEHQIDAAILIVASAHPLDVASHGLESVSHKLFELLGRQAVDLFPVQFESAEQLFCNPDEFYSR